MIFFLPRLSYAAVAPAGLPSLALVRERGRAVVERVILVAAGGDEEAKEPVAPWEREGLEQTLQQALVTELGPWAEGVFWNASEPGGGGPVRAYCCYSHSLFVGDGPLVAGSVENVLAALEEWHTFLTEQTLLFDNIRANTESASVEERIVTAAGELLPLVLVRTEASDAWYNTFTAMLTWFAESCGYDRAAVGPVIADTVSGRFASWIEPAVEIAGPAVRALGTLVATAVATLPVPAEDTLARWARTRGKAIPHRQSDSLPLTWDGHTRFIEGAETDRDADRAARMSLALQACRESARAREPLDFASLARWQRIVLAREAPFRAGEAFAKQGRDRYGLDEHTQARFETWLAEATDEAIPFATRAARVYLDICFTHPFDDGNARSARLALDYVLIREGRWLRNVEPLFSLSRSPGDTDITRHLAWSIGFLSGPLDGLPILPIAQGPRAAPAEVAVHLVGASCVGGTVRTTRFARVSRSENPFWPNRTA